MFNFKRSALLVVGLLALAPLSSAQPKKPAPATPPPAAPASGAKDAKAGGIETAVLVLDASGSMNDKVGGASKIAAAKDAVSKLVDSWDKTVPLGLTVYGHRNGTCNDIESVIPVGPIDAGKFKSAITGLAANGSTPLTEAVIQAAEQLDYENNQATVILVSDGEESCGGDPCEMAKKLEEMGVDLTIHVVGFAVTADQAEGGLSCIAKNTGGQYKTVQDAASLSDALKSMVRDAEERKTKWRHRWGDGWGKNGRWLHGFWKVGFKDHHKKHWMEWRKRWHHGAGPHKPAPSHGRP